MSHPEIRIKKSFLLNDRVIPLLKSELNELGRQDEASSEYIDSKGHEYKSSWSAYE